MADGLDLDAVCQQVIALLVSTFDFPEAEARQRINLWKARQHDLEGQALQGILPHLSPEERAQELLRWALQGDQLEAELRKGATDLGIPLEPPRPER